MSEAIAHLDDAVRSGHHLVLDARSDLGAAIAAWLGCIAPPCELEGDDAAWLVSALYEACGNIVEHGYEDDPARTLDLWWLPGAVTPADAQADARSRVAMGLFVIRDDGTPFRAPESVRWDARDDVSRRRGRGIGLDIIHRVMRVVSYNPGTPRGNITLLRFGPTPAAGGRAA